MLINIDAAQLTTEREGITVYLKENEISNTWQLWNINKC